MRLSTVLFCILFLSLCLLSYSIPHETIEIQQQSYGQYSLQYSFLQTGTQAKNSWILEQHLTQDEETELQYYLEMILSDYQQFKQLFQQAFQVNDEADEQEKQTFSKHRFSEGLDTLAQNLGIRSPSFEEYQEIFNQLQLEDETELTIDEAQQGAQIYLRNCLKQINPLFS